MAYRYKVIGTDLKMGGKLYKEGAVFVSLKKLDYSCLEPVKDEVPKGKAPKGKKSKVADEL